MTRDGDARRSELRSIGLRLRPTDRYLSIATNDERIERYIRTSYGGLVAPSVPREGTDRAVIATGRGPSTVTFNGVSLPRPSSAGGFDPLNSGAYLVDQFLWRSLARDATWLALYGCAVAYRGRVIALVGASGTGKTTLGLVLTRRGARLYGDEMILIHRRDAIATVIARRLAIRERTLALLDDDRLNAVVRASHQSTVGDERTYYVGCAALQEGLGDLPPPLPLGGLVVLRRGEGPSRLRPISRARAALGAASFLAARPGTLTEVAALVSVLGDAAAFDLTVGDPHAAAQLLLEAIDG
jgi:hypothetical protein